VAAVLLFEKVKGLFIGSNNTSDWRHFNSHAKGRIVSHKGNYLNAKQKRIDRNLMSKRWGPVVFSRETFCGADVF